MTVLAFERYQADPSNVARFEELALERVAAMRSAPGILWADLLRASDDGSGFLLLSEWRTEDEAGAFGPPSDDLGPVLIGETTKRLFRSSD